MNKYGRRFAVSLMLVVGTWTSMAMAGDVVVSAASSLTNAFRKVANVYEAKHPGTHVVLNFAASDVLMRQIANGAPADVYASADEKTMNDASAQGLLVAGSRKDFAANQLVLIVPSTSALTVSRLDDLNKPVFKRLAYGDPASVPVGRYTKGALQKAGLWETLSGKGVLAENVRQALDYVARDEVDAGFVYSTDAAILPGKVKIAFRVPAPTPIRYPMAVLSHAKNPAAAQSFEDFVLSPEGQQLLAGFGFLAP